MGVSEFCVGVVITLIIIFVTMVIGFLSEEESLSWLVSSIGFGICLTILLFQNGWI